MMPINTKMSLRGTFALLFSLIVVSPAQAYFATFDNRDAFTQIASNLTNIDFEGYAPEQSYRYYGSNGLDVGDVHFSGSNNYLYIVDDDFYPIYYDWGSDAILFGYKGGTITAMFSEGVNAVGSDFMALLGTGSGYQKGAADFTVTLSNGSSFDVSSLDYPDRAFFGVISDDFSIRSISYTSEANAYLQLDNFVYGDYEGGGSTDVPVPGLPLLMGIGLVAMRRWRG